MKDSAAPISVVVPRSTSVRHFVLAALCVITTISYVQRNSLAAAATLVMGDLGVDIVGMGYAKGGFFFAYALCQIPSGWLAQRWGSRRTLALYAAGWSLFMGWTAAAKGLTILVGLRAAMGALQAGIFPCCTMILVSWYPAARRGFASAILNSFMLIGGAIAAQLTALLIGPLGWRGLFALYALPGLVWALWFIWWFRNHPREHVSVNSAELSLLTAPVEQASGLKEPPSETPAPSAPIPWVRIFCSSSLWLICFQQCCRAGASRFLDQSLPTYLQQARGQSIEDANWWTSLPLGAGVIGGMLGGILSDAVLRRTGSRRAARQGVAIVSLLLAVLFYAWAYQFADVRWAMLTASVGVCIMTFAAPCAYALTMDMSGRNLGVIFGTMNMAGNLGAWAFTTFIPMVVKWRNSWDDALFVFAAMHVVALLCWLPLNPNGVIGERPASAP